MIFDVMPLPYSLQMDDAIVIILLGCFLISAYVFSRSRSFLLQLGKEFLLHRDRISLFADSTAANIRSFFLLILQLCILAGVYIYCFFVTKDPRVLEVFSSFQWVGIYVLFFISYLGVKWLFTLLIGWTFLDKSLSSLYLESYSTILYYLSTFLYPVTLVVVYSNMLWSNIALIGIILVAFIKLLMLYKWFRFFSTDLYGNILLFLYFCALEIMPLLLLSKAMIELNESLIIKN